MSRDSVYVLAVVGEDVSLISALLWKLRTVDKRHIFAVELWVEPAHFDALVGHLGREEWLDFAERQALPPVRAASRPDSDVGITTHLLERDPRAETCV